MKKNVLPAVLREHPELERLLKYAEGNPETQAALMQFFRSCEGLTAAQLAGVLERVARFLREEESYPEFL